MRTTPKKAAADCAQFKCCRTFQAIRELAKRRALACTADLSAKASATEEALGAGGSSSAFFASRDKTSAKRRINRGFKNLSVQLFCTARSKIARDTLDRPVILSPAKDRPVLFTAAAWAQLLLTLDRGDFGAVMGRRFYGLDVLTPGDFLETQTRRRTLNIIRAEVREIPVSH